jgi:hypothetical protein
MAAGGVNAAHRTEWEAQAGVKAGVKEEEAVADEAETRAAKTEGEATAAARARTTRRRLRGML